MKKKVQLPWFRFSAKLLRALEKDRYLLDLENDELKARVHEAVEKKNYLDAALYCLILVEKDG